MTAVTPIKMIRSGLVDYRAAWTEQQRIHEAVASGADPGTVLLLEHPSVYTAGKRTQPMDRPVDGTEVIDVDRGGKITWHGPGQLVGYPIVRLVEPMPYVRFMSLIAGARAVVTDSGGIQEETTYLGIPCFTLRESTERPITVTEGTNRLVTADNVAGLVRAALNGGANGHARALPKPEYWDGRTAGRCIEDLRARSRS